MLLTLLHTLLPSGGSAVYAADSAITVKATYSYDTGLVEVSGVMAAGEGKAVTIRIEYPSGKLYVNQTTSGEDGNYSIAYKLNGPVEGVYQVYAGGSGIAAPATTQFQYKAPTPGGDQGSGSTSGEGVSPYSPVTASGTTAKATAKSDNGRLTANLSAGFLNGLDLEQLEDEGELTIELTGDAGESSLAVELPAAIWNETDGALKRLIIRTHLGEFVFDADAIPWITSSASRVKLEIEALEPEDLPNIDEKVWQGHKLYRFHLSVDEREVHDFNGTRPVLITIPYSHSQGETPASIVVYYVADNGELEVVPFGQLDPSRQSVSFYAPHFSVYAAKPNEVRFTDLAGASWVEQPIQYLAARSVIDGVGGGKFSPGRSITRAEFVKMLLGGLNLKADSNGDSAAFRDVSAEAWYADSVAAAVELGIAAGYGDGSFGPERAVTREEAFVMAARALRAAGIEAGAVREPLPFADSDHISAYAADDIKLLSAAGLIDGRGEDRLQPQGAITRAEAAKVIAMLMELPFHP